MHPLDQMRKIAGIEVLSEQMGSRTHQLALKVIQMAKSDAYENTADTGQANVTDVQDRARALMDEISNIVSQKLQVDADSNAQEVASTQVSTAHGFETGTAAGGDLTANDGTNLNI